MSTHRIPICHFVQFNGGELTRHIGHKDMLLGTLTSFDFGEAFLKDSCLANVVRF